jgi:hypothetical protein
LRGLTGRHKHEDWIRHIACRGDLLDAAYLIARALRKNSTCESTLFNFCGGRYTFEQNGFISDCSEYDG